MTPEERARAVVAYWYRGPYWGNGFDPEDEDRKIEIADIAKAIREAVTEEREACVGVISEIGHDLSEMARSHSNELRYAFDHFFVAMELRVLHREEDWPIINERLQQAVKKAPGPA